MTKIWYVYMLHLHNRAYYTGITNDVEARMATHRSGKGSKYVRAHLPFRLVYLEKVGSRSEATRREIEIKRSGRMSKIALVLDKANLATEATWPEKL